MSKLIERIAAAAIAVAVNALVVACIANAMRPAWINSAGAEQAIEVVFLSPKAEDAPPRMPLQMRQPIASRARKPPEVRRLDFHQVSASPQPPQMDVSPSSRSTTMSTTDDWSALAPAPVGEAKDTFAKNPLVHRPLPMQASIDRLRLTFHDHSIGAKLKEMSRKAACRELSAALSTNPASTNAILGSMKEWGCRSL